MKRYKKTLFGSMIAFFVGTSCCWLSSLAIWVGGVTLTGMAVNIIDDIQLLMISLGMILLITTIFLYSKMSKKKLSENKS